MAGFEQHDPHLDALLAAALSSIPPAIVLFDRDRRPVWCNRSMDRLLAPGGDTADLPSVFGPLVSPGGALDEPLVAAYDETPTRIDPIAMETSGGIVEREGWVGPVGAGDGQPPMAVMVLPAEEERLHPLLANTHDIISVLAADGTIRYSNPAAGNLMSYEGQVLAGTSALDLVHPDDQEIVAQAMTDVSSVDGEALRLRLRFGDGRWHHCLVHLADRLADPAVNGVVVTVHDITDQVEAHDELVRSEQWVRRLLAQLTDVIVVADERGRITYVSPSIVELVGMPEDIHAGTGIFEDVHPDDVGRVRTLFDDLRAEPEGERRVTFRLRHRAGHHVWVEAVAVNALEDPAVGGIIATLRNVTELKQAEEMSTGLVKAAPDAMVVVDDDGTIVLANERSEALFGWPADELVGRSVDSLVPDAARGRHREHRAGYAADPRGRMMGEGIELVAMRRDGTEVPVEVSLSTHDTHRGRLTSAAIRDITAQRETRRALEAALRGEQEVVSRLQEADALKAEFVSTVAHELKGPLSAISGFARLIERMLQAEELSTPQVPDMATRISANADRLLEMIEQLLRFSRLEAGQARIHPEQVAVEEMVQRSLELLGDSLDQHDVVVSVPAGMTLWGDADGIANVLRNLLTTAAKFGPPGTKIWVEAEGSDGGARVSISDEGPGVEPDERQAVFEQFHQTADGRARGGSGIGLSIARRYVELHGGEIGVDQRPGAGARFWFTLPPAASAEH